uniref:Uncharacterized protein n=1 Tax=Rhizophora mucronata TaxID=61149 RepID=A0A2P2LGR0_RHIMU
MRSSLSAENCVVVLHIVFYPSFFVSVAIFPIDQLFKNFSFNFLS